MNKITWDRLAEVGLLLIAVIMTGVGVAVRIESKLAVLDNRMNAIDTSYITINKDFMTYKSKVDEIYGMHINPVAIPEKKYQLKRNQNSQNFYSKN